MPFISEVLETNVVVHEYTGTQFEESFKDLIKSKEEGGRGYKHIRRLRRDGNCFYRAFLFQLFEHYSLHMETHKAQYDKLIKIVEDSKDDLVTNAGYDSIVIEDFHEIFLDNLKKLATLPVEWKKLNDGSLYEEFVHKHIISILCNHEEAMYIIMFARFLAAGYLKKNAILFEDFVGGDIHGFCTREVE